MKKFILSITVFALGVLGTMVCLINSTVLESVYTRTGLTDSMSTYTYVSDPLAIVGIIMFTFTAIAGLLFSIKHAKQEEVV